MLSVMRVIGDHAVLQSGCENRIFGYALANEDISLLVSGSKTVSMSAKSDENGRWEMTLPPFEPSLSAFTFTFECGTEGLTFTDVYFGELFHISGQSNMELPMYRTLDPLKPSDLPTCGYIREFRVPVECRFGKDDEYEDFPGGEWKTADKENVPGMSAAGFYFAYELYRKYGVPVGLLNTSAGGAPVEAFMPYTMLSELGGYDEFLSKCTVPDFIGKTERSDRQRNAERAAEIEKLDRVSEDVLAGNAGFIKCTVPFDLNDTAELKNFCGKIWFRKIFDIPENADLSDALLILGTITDADKTYLNGTLIGETDYMYPPRYYPVPRGVIRHGNNELLVCVDVRYGGGGFTIGKDYCIKLTDRVVDLSGEWGYAVAAKVPPMERETFFQGLPLSLYAAHAAPSFNVRCRALIWYQGESNCSHPERYAFLFRKFVELYRERCGYDIPVIFTQLCSFDDPFANGTDCWAELRNAQLECLKIPGTDMAVTIDLGEYNDLHPKNKRDVGKRLARCAMRTVYADKSIPADVFCIGASLPEPGKLLLRFTDNARVRLTAGREECFDICFADGILQADNAEVTADGLLLTFCAASQPVKVRCEWRNEPGTPALYHDCGIPLSPFGIKVE